jgi:serine/threonine protein phosphatase PrpC
MSDSAPTIAPADLCICGTPLSEMDVDGFCSGCGRRLKRPPEDHIEIELLPDFAGVSDRGLRHSRNEDRFALVRSGNSYALIVCDGVSMSPDADQASSSAVQAAFEVFTKGLAETDFVAVDLLRESIQQAAQAVSQLAKQSSESPSTTLVAAILRDNQLTVGWLGDSRAYWLVGSEATQITHDHSWLNSRAAREVGVDVAKSPNAHALMRWVGADAPDLEPEIVQRKLAGEGMLLLCSDGLWNYAPGVQDIAALITRLNTPDASALSLSRELVEFARSKGGHDNITAAILRYPVSEGHPHSG